MKPFIILLLCFIVNTFSLTLLHYYGFISYSLSFLLMQIVAMFLYFLLGSYINKTKATYVALVIVLLCFRFKLYSFFKIVCLLLGFILQRKYSFI